MNKWETASLPFAYINSAKLVDGVSLFGDIDQKTPWKTLEEAGTPEENQEEAGSSREARHSRRT